ncbi:MAG: nucleotidyltransferase family protein [Acidimicrobiia bacterium]|nr:nucleotidyltransferase family protein [Acidimicrobiia bacterium]
MENPLAEQRQLLRLVVDKLTALEIVYMVSGSLASSLHGEPRMTRDIDIVVDGSADQLRSFAGSFDPATHYVTDPIVALSHRSMFTIVEIPTGWKVDLMIRKDRVFSRTELERRMWATIGDVELMVVSPEDSILSKLEWMKLSESDRQLADVSGIIAAYHDNLDWDYIQRWAAELGLEDELARTRGDR